MAQHPDFQLEPRAGMPPEFLVVDDDSVLANALTSILNMNGYPCVPAYDGDEAVAKARLIRPKLILMDVMMPHMYGTEAAIEILKEQPDCRIWLFSCVRQAADLLNDAQSKGYEFEVLAKPIHPNELFRKLSELGFKPKGQPPAFQGT